MTETGPIAGESVAAAQAAEGAPAGDPPPSSDSGAAAGEPAAPPPAPAGDAWADVLSAYDREARALEAAKSPAAARLHHAIGRVWERNLKSPRNAAVAYQNAFLLDPKYRPNLVAARRLFLQVGDFERALQLVDKELEATPEKAAQAEVLREKAALLHRASRSDEAAAVLEQALGIDPQHPTLLEAALEAAEERGDTARQIELHERFAGATRDALLQTLHLGDAARLREASGDAAGAQSLYDRIFQASPHDASARAVLAARYIAAQDWEKLARVMEAEADATHTASAHYRLAQFLLDHFPERARKLSHMDAMHPEALEHLLHARETAPRDMVVLDALAAYYDASPQMPGIEDAAAASLAELLGARADGARDPLEKVAVRLQLAAVLERAGKDEDALARLREALAENPGSLEALRRIARLLEKKKDLEGLLALSDGEAAAATDPRRKADALYRAGALCEERLQKPEEASRRYLTALEAFPQHAASRLALESLYRKSGEDELLSDLYEQQIAQATSPEEKATAYALLAGQGDAAFAAGIYGRALAEGLTTLPLAPLRRVACEKAGLVKEAAEALAAEAAHAKGPWRAAIAHRVAQLVRPNDAQAAEEHERYALDADPHFVPALRALGQAYRAAGRATELADLYRREAEAIEDGPTAASMLYLAAEQILGTAAATAPGSGETAAARPDLETASAFFAAALERDPSHFPTLKALERLHRTRSEWTELAAALRSQADALKDNISKADALYKAGEVVEEKLSDAEMALSLYQEGAAAHPRHAGCHREFARLLLAAGRYAEAAQALEKVVAITQMGEKLEAMRTLASIYGDRLGLPEKAEDLWAQVLEQEPSDLHTMAALERLARARGERDRAAEMRSRLAAKCADPRASAAMRASAAADRMASGNTAAAVAEYRRALALNPQDRLAGNEVENAFWAAGDYPALFDHLSRSAGYADQDTKVVLTHERGEIAEVHLDRGDAALQSYREALSGDPSYLPSLRAAQRLLRARGEEDALRRYLAQEGEHAKDQARAVEALLEAAQLAADKLDDEDRAVLHLQDALMRDPVHAEASRRLQDLLARHQKFPELVAFRERQGTTLEDPKLAAQAWVEAARLYRDNLDDARGLFISAGRALAKDPDNGDALELRADGAEKQQRFPEAAQALEKRLLLGGDPQRLAALRARLGTIYQVHLGDAAKAREHLDQARALMPADAASLETFAQAAEAGGDWAGAVDSYRKLLDHPEVERARRGHFARRLGQACEELDDVPSAAANYRRALEFDPSDREAIELLERVHGETQDWEGLARTYADCADRVSPVEKERSVPVRLKAAEVFLNKLGDPSRAVAQLQLAVQADPAARDARVALAGIYAESDATYHLAAAEWSALAAADPLAAEPYRKMHALYLQHGQLDGAYCAASVLAFLGHAAPGEQAFAKGGQGRLPLDGGKAIAPEDWENLVVHASEKGAARQVITAIGGELSRVYQANPLVKEDRLPAAHPARKLCEEVGRLLGASVFDVYQDAQYPLVASVENTEPPALVFGVDVLAKATPRQLRFLAGQLLGRVRDRNFIAMAWQGDEGAVSLATLVGSAVRLFDANFQRFGARDDDLVRALAKSLSGKTMATLQTIVPQLQRGAPPDFAHLLAAMWLSADRAGLIACNDPWTALGMAFRDYETGAPAQGADWLRGRPEGAEMLLFSVSEPYLGLRAKLGLALG